MTGENIISDAFESTFLAVPLEAQISHCDHYELTGFLAAVLPGHQPILEAGCGSGRWVGWFVQQGWQATGVDWSEALCNAAREAIPGGRFVAADIADVPLDAASFGSVVALGSIEHTEEGPSAILAEFRRLLVSGGVAIVTVPYLGPVRRLRRVVRRLLGRRDERRVRPPGAYAGTWEADYHHDDRGWSFFQYVFSRRQMRRFIRDAGFTIEREFVDFKEEGVLHVFGRLAGDYDYANARVRFSLAGRVLKLLLPTTAIAHMLCYHLRKSP